MPAILHIVTFPVPIAVALAWIVFRANALPASWLELAMLAAAGAAYIIEARVSRVIWVSDMSSARSPRLAVTLAVTLVSAHLAWRFVNHWPFTLDHFTTRRGLVLLADAFAQHPAPLIIYVVAGGVGLGLAVHGALSSVSMSLRLAFDAMGGRRRRRAKSDLHGASRLMTNAELRRLAPRNSGQVVTLGQIPRLGKPLLHYNLHGSITTYAPPRTGKTALIIANHLRPGGRGWQGSTVTMDPRGNAYCVCAKRLRELGRTVRLIDPYGLVADHVRRWPELEGLETRSDTFNPLDLLRVDDYMASDVSSLLDALFAQHDNQASAGHFHALAKSILSGFLAFERASPRAELRNLGRAMHYTSMAPTELDALKDLVEQAPFTGDHLTLHAISRLKALAGRDEGASLQSTVANQLAFARDPILSASIERSSFDVHELLEGKTDLFLIAPQTHFRTAAPWLRVLLSLPMVIAERGPRAGDILVYLDEMPSVGKMPAVMDSFNMAAGSGVHYWCFSQTPSALESAYGKSDTAIIRESAEVVQVLGFPPNSPDVAKSFSETIGTATWHGHSASLSSGSQLSLKADTQSTRNSETLQETLVKEALLTPEQLMRLPADQQIIITATREVERNAILAHHLRYWTRSDAAGHAGPDPTELQRSGATPRPLPRPTVDTATPADEDLSSGSLPDPDPSTPAHGGETPPAPAPPPAPSIRTQDPSDADGAPLVHVDPATTLAPGATDTSPETAPGNLRPEPDDDLHATNPEPPTRKPISPEHALEALVTDIIVTAQTHRVNAVPVASAEPSAGTPPSPDPPPPDEPPPGPPPDRDIEDPHDPETPEQLAKRIDALTPDPIFDDDGALTAPLPW